MALFFSNRLKTVFHIVLDSSEKSSTGEFALPYHQTHFSKSIYTTSGQTSANSQLHSVSIGICFGVSESSCQYTVTEKTFTGHLKMAEVQLIHLAQPTRYHELIGETIDPWCHIYMQKNWINKETSGYFRCHQNDPYGCLTEMYNLARN